MQIANSCWELYCLEHGIDQYGRLHNSCLNNKIQTFFGLSNSQKLVPHTVLVDSDPTVIDEVRTGIYSTLFKPQNLISGKEDSGSNYGRGYFTLGRELIETTMDSLRHVAESCTNLKGFLVFRAAGGGTGSGLGNRIMEEIVNEYGKISKMDFVIFPSPSFNPLIAEPYNTLLSIHTGMDCSDCTFILDNEALYDICAMKLDIYTPQFVNVNRIIAQVISTLTTSQRFQGSLGLSLHEFQTNLVPFPRIHYPLVSYSPLVGMGNACFTALSTGAMTFDCFHTSSQLVRCNPRGGKLMSCVLMYRGNVLSADVNYSIQLLKSKGSLNLVDWSPTGFKIGINYMPPVAVYGGDIGPTDRAMIAMSNNTAIQRAWQRMLKKYMCLFDRRAFLHNFLEEGLEEGTFIEASEDIRTLIMDYRQVEELSGGLPSKIPSESELFEPKMIECKSSRSESTDIGSAFSGDYDSETECRELFIIQIALKINSCSNDTLLLKNGVLIFQNQSRRTNFYINVNGNGNFYFNLIYSI